MYHPSMAYGSQVRRWVGLMCTKVLVPGGAIGVLVKVCWPSKMAYADNFGLMLEGRGMLRVAWACGMSLHHRCMGKSDGVEDRPAMK